MLPLDTAPVVEIPTESVITGPRLRKNLVVRASTTESIARHGLIHPLLVRTLPDGRYMLIVGQCRLEALRSLGRKTVPARVIEADDEYALDLERDENTERVPLSELELSIKRREWCLREYGQALAQRRAAAALEPAEPAVAEDGTPAKKPRRRREATDEAVAAATHVPRSTINRDRHHVDAVERYPVLAHQGKIKAIALAKSLDEVDPEANPTIAALLEDELEDEPETLERAVETVAAMPPEEQRRVARLYASADEGERREAVETVRAVTVPDLCASSIRNGLGLFRTALTQLAAASTFVSDPALQGDIREKFGETRALIAREQEAWLRLGERSRAAHEGRSLNGVQPADTAAHS